MVSVDEMKFLEGMELLEKELGSIESEMDDSFGNDSFDNDSLELNIKRAPSTHRKRDQKMITERRCSTGSVQSGVADLKNDQTKLNRAAKLSGESLRRKVVAHRRFSSCAA